MHVFTGVENMMLAEGRFLYSGPRCFAIRLRKLRSGATGEGY
jgi:hypothetical protein